ncbi:MAG: MarR family winged helix-turn-helix transcriptional regulator [Microbacterium sp.]
MTSCTGDHADDPRDEAIRTVESEFILMAGRFRQMIARRAETLSPGLLPAEYKVFTTVAKGGPLKAADIADQMILDKSHLSRIITSLEKRELVIRTPDPSDGRAQLIAAVPEALERLEEIRRDPSESTIRERLADWDVEEISRLGDLLTALNHSGAGARTPSS